MHSLRTAKTGATLAVFALAMLYASACSASCFALDFAPPAPAENSACHTRSESQPAAPAHRGSQDSGCTAHIHHDAVLKAPATPQFHPAFFSTAGGPVAARVLPPLDSDIAAELATTHAPPHPSKQPLYKKISLLRI